MDGSVDEISREIVVEKQTEFMLKGAEEPRATIQSVRSSDEARETGGSEGTQEGGSRKEHMTENKPASVTEPKGTPKQAGETRNAMAWVDRSVWTERMLQRLAQSQQQTKWFALWDKVWREETLMNASLQVIVNRGSAGVDRQSTEQFQREWTEQIRKLQEELRNGSYDPYPALRAYLEKPGSTELRPLGIPAVRDRVVQGALKSVMEPIYEWDFVAQSYGFRPGKSAQQALQRVEELLDSGHEYIVDADLKGYFDSIPHERLMKLLRERIADGAVLGLIQKYLDAGVMEEGKGWEPSTAGTPQGSVISPLLANVYLHPLDVKMKETGREMVRYADDFVVLCRSREEAEQALEAIQQWVASVGLQLHPTKTRIASLEEGFEFLGFRYCRSKQTGKRIKVPRKKSLMKLRQRIREKTSRMRSEPMEFIIQELNPSLKGWYGYFRTSLPSALGQVDGWVRRRLRSIARYRKKRKGISKGRENVAYTNQWFQERGLFTLFRSDPWTEQS